MTDPTVVQPDPDVRPPEHVTVMPDEVVELLAAVPPGARVRGFAGGGVAGAGASQPVSASAGCIFRNPPGRAADRTSRHWHVRPA